MVPNGNLHSYELILISVGFLSFNLRANIHKRIVYSVSSGNLAINKTKKTRKSKSTALCDLVDI